MGGCAHSRHAVFLQPSPRLQFRGALRHWLHEHVCTTGASGPPRKETASRPCCGHHGVEFWHARLPVGRWRAGVVGRCQFSQHVRPARRPVDAADRCDGGLAARRDGTRRERGGRRRAALCPGRVPDRRRGDVSRACRRPFGRPGSNCDADLHARPDLQGCERVPRTTTIRPE